MVAALSLRLVAGTLRGRRLETPAGVRPTGARLREALASIWRDRLPGRRFLDLFAGSGAVGLEAWSLGAAQVTFVESAPRVLAVLRRNVAALAPAAEIVRGRLPGALDALAAEPFDVVFADPPYAFDDYAALLCAAAAHTRPGGAIAVEHSARVELAAEAALWRCRDRRRYGETCVSFFEIADGESAHRV